MSRIIPTTILAVGLLASGCGQAPPDEKTAGQRIGPWLHLSSANGDLPAPGPSEQQTGSWVADFDKDGVNDFVIVCRVEGPSVTWYRRTADGWDKYIIDDEFLRIEAGGAALDVDGDGDLDLIFGGDSGSHQMWWWENPYPDYDPAINWARYLIKDSGERKHHDQIAGDFDGDGEAELVSWNQRAKALLLFEIPDDPKAGPWPAKTIYEWTDGEEHEGLAAADINADGKVDLIGGGRWFEHTASGEFTPHVIDDNYRFSRAAAGDLVEGGRPEVVFQPGDADGRLRWYEWDGAQWTGHDAMAEDIIHGHSLAVLDMNGDGHADIFSAEMGQWGREPIVNPSPAMRILYGDGQGGFRATVVSDQFGNHESRPADLDGDGDMDILGKPYNWRTPRVDIWLWVGE